MCSRRVGDNLYFRLWADCAVLTDAPLDLASRKLASVCLFVHGVCTSFRPDCLFNRRAALPAFATMRVGFSRPKAILPTAGYRSAPYLDLSNRTADFLFRTYVNIPDPVRTKVVDTQLHKLANRYSLLAPFTPSIHRRMCPHLSLMSAQWATGAV